MGITNITIEIFAMIITLLLIVFAGKNHIPRCQEDKFFLVMLSLNLIVLFSDCLTWCLPQTREFNLLLYLFNFLVFAIGYIIIACFTYYLVLHISEKKEISIWIARIIGIMCIVAIVLVLLSFFNNYFFYFENGVYARGKYYWVSQLYPILILIFDMVIIIRYRKFLALSDIIPLLSYTFLPILAMIIQLFVYGITFLYIATTLSLLVIFFSIVVEQSNKLQETELEIAQMRVYIMLSQIQPHFLYNSLSSIAALCDIDANGAQKAIVMFSDYLRGNLDSIKRNAPVTFDKELEHVKIYLELEKMRFGEDLNVEWDIETNDFFLPALTVQPIVENSVNHGLGMKEDGGTVRISTIDKDTEIQIIIADDGVGFNPHCIQEDGRAHIGIDNVKKRLEAQINATLEIVSEENVGTSVTIRIPKEK